MNKHRSGWEDTNELAPRPVKEALPEYACPEKKSASK